MTSAEGMIVMSAHAAGWTVVSPDAPLQRPLIGAELASPDFRVSYYPMAECFRAFDACVGAAGYNTVNELEHFGIPALLIPRSRGLDDQFKRAAEAEQGGAALVADLDQPQIEAKLRILHDDDTLRSQMSAAGRRLVPGNGAKTAAQEILGLL